MNPFLGEIRLISFNFAPKGWALCNGQLLLISQNQALFSILGTTYGGNGITTFALPNLQGRVPVHTSSQTSLGQSGGEEVHMLVSSEMAAHSHTAMGSDSTADQLTPANNYWGSNSGASPYSSNSAVTLSSAAMSTAGGGQAHENRPPFLVLNFAIALQGIFPSQA